MPQTRFTAICVGLFFAAGAWGLYWMPQRALEAAGMSGGWWTIAQYILCIAILAPIAALRMKRGQQTGLDLPLAGLLMGGGQALALQPGVSRSGATISVARVLGFDRTSAARLAFLMSLPVIAGAGVFRGLSVASEGFPTELVGGFLVGMAASAVTGWLAVWGTLKLVRSRTFTPFVIYRVLLGAGVLIALAV